jgi:glycosyltransferase involved in cell wall biosynthesis
MRGTAVVASSAGGITEFVAEGRTGFLTPPGDDRALGAALARVLGDRDSAELLGSNARRFALAELTEERFLDRVEALYARLVQPARNATGKRGGLAVGAGRSGASGRRIRQR